MIKKHYYFAKYTKPGAPPMELWRVEVGFANAEIKLGPWWMQANGTAIGQSLVGASAVAGKVDYAVLRAQQKSGKVTYLGEHETDDSVKAQQGPDGYWFETLSSIVQVHFDGLNYVLIEPGTTKMRLDTISHFAALTKISTPEGVHHEVVSLEGVEILPDDSLVVENIYGRDVMSRMDASTKCYQLFEQQVQAHAGVDNFTTKGLGVHPTLDQLRNLVLTGAHDRLAEEAKKKEVMAIKLAAEKAAIEAAEQARLAKLAHVTKEVPSFGLNDDNFAEAMKRKREHAEAKKKMRDGIADIARRSREAYEKKRARR